MKNIKTILCLLLASVMIVGASCKNGGDSSSSTPEDSSGGSSVVNPVNPVKPNSFGDVKGELHEYKITETNNYIIKDGKTDYKILIPQGMAENDYISAAASDIKLMFLEATGIELEVVEDGKQSAGDKFLAIHSTSLCTAESIGATREALGRGGFRIVTKGENVIMCGAIPESSMYAAYEFLHQALGFDLLYTDYYVLDKNVKNLKLMNYDVTDIPDFEYRMQSTGWIRYNDQNRKRMKWTNDSDWIIPVNGNNWHNTFDYLPPETYKASNSEWYSEPRGDQLCYTAHGDEESRAEMINIVSAKVIELFSMETYKDYNHISISIQDNQNCCICDTCAAAKQKYGADSAVMVLFLNDVAKIVEAWMNTDAGAAYKRDFRILFFAYHATNAAPVVYDSATKEYKPSAPEVVCHPNVAVYFAETNGDYTQNFHDEGTANTQVGKNMKGWAVLSKEIYFWSYSTNFSHFLTPYNSFDTVQDILKFAKNEGTMFAMIQDQWVQGGGQTGFGVYKNWLHSKLEWDVNANVSELEDYFFDNYFWT